MSAKRALAISLMLFMSTACQQKEKDAEINRLQSELETAKMTAAKKAADEEHARLLRELPEQLKLTQISCACTPTQVQLRCHIRSDAKVAAKVVVRGGGSVKIGDDWPWLESQSSITLQPNFETDMDINTEIKSGACVEVKNCKCEVTAVALQ